MKILKRLFTGLSLLVSSIISFGAFAGAADISADEFVAMDKQEIVLLDVRTVKEYNDGYIPGAINLPLDDLPELFSQLGDKDQKIVVYCRSGFRAGKAIKLLSDKGFNNLVHLDGDFKAWSAQERPIAKP